MCIAHLMDASSCGHSMNLLALVIAYSMVWTANTASNKEKSTRLGMKRESVCPEAP